MRNDWLIVVILCSFLFGCTRQKGHVECPKVQAISSVKAGRLCVQFLKERTGKDYVVKDVKAKIPGWVVTLDCRVTSAKKSRLDESLVFLDVEFLTDACPAGRVLLIRTCEVSDDSAIVEMRPSELGDHDVHLVDNVESEEKAVEASLTVAGRTYPDLRCEPYSVMERKAGWYVSLEAKDSFYGMVADVRIEIDQDGHISPPTSLFEPDRDEIRGVSVFGLKPEERKSD